jgi:hypothetical protein
MAEDFIFEYENSIIFYYKNFKIFKINRDLKKKFIC